MELTNEVKYPTKKDLIHYYSANRKYFDQLAHYYYEHDKEFYNGTVYPIYNSNPVRLVTCPFCYESVTPFVSSGMSTSGIIMIGIGVLLTPILIGIFLISFGVGMKETRVMCPSCKMKIGD